MREQLDLFEPCRELAPGMATLNVQFRFSEAGRRAAVTAATGASCELVQCARQQLEQMEIEVEGELTGAVGLVLSLGKDQSPQTVEVTELDWDELACTDQSGPGRLPREVIQSRVRASYRDFRACFADGLGRNADLRGRVQVRFVIGRDGRVTSVQSVGSNIPDCEVIRCVMEHYKRLVLPKPDEGEVTVVYPIMFDVR